MSGIRSDNRTRAQDRVAASGIDSATEAASSWSRSANPSTASRKRTSRETSLSNFTVCSFSSTPAGSAGSSACRKRNLVKSSDSATAFQHGSSNRRARARDSSIEIGSGSIFICRAGGSLSRVNSAVAFVSVPLISCPCRRNPAPRTNRNTGPCRNPPSE